MPGLTAKQEQFAKNVGIRNMGLTEAYRTSGYSTDNMAAKTLSTRAAEVHQHSGVSVAIRGYQSEITREMKASIVSDKDIVLKSLRFHAVDSDSHSNQIRATEVLGRTIPGLYRGEEPVAEQRTPAEIQTELVDLIKALDIKADQAEETTH